MGMNEIKKALYKQNPMASFEYIRKGLAYYRSNLNDGTVISFEIPVSDMGDADFNNYIEAKYLIRWIV